MIESPFEVRAARKLELLPISRPEGPERRVQEVVEREARVVGHRPDLVPPEYTGPVEVDLLKLCLEDAYQSETEPEDCLTESGLGLVGGGIGFEQRGCVVVRSVALKAVF